MPDFSTLCRRQWKLNVSIPYRGGAGPLNLLVESTGIKAGGEGESNARKHGGAKRRIWRNLHIGIDEETLEVRAIEITGSSIGDAPMLPELLDQIPRDQETGSVTADGAYDTRKCHEAIAARNAAAIIPPRKNAKPRRPTSPGAVARNEALRASKYLGNTKLLANEWAPHGITVNAIAPGYIATNNTEALRDDPERSRQLLERIPAGRWGRPEDIGGAAAFLCSPAARYMTGAVLNVDGGWMAR